MSRYGMATARIQMLDNSFHTYDVKMKNYGNALLQTVMKDLDLLEADYFGIQYRDRDGNEVFLDPLKKIEHEIPNISNAILKFVVKFFPPDPGQLLEEYTRYLFALQIKQDIAQGILSSSERTLAVLASYIAQSEFGDWDATECSDLSYLEDLQILPAQYESAHHDMFMKISERHKSITGETPEKADYHLLDIARRLDTYGVRMHPARDQENAEINLAVAHMGVLVYRGGSKINTFNWSRIRKLSFKKKRFLIKLKTEAFVDNQVKTVGGILDFLMTSRNACKIFWKHCIECHAFFRLEVHPPPLPHPVILKRGSTFRYSGRTQRQLDVLVRNSHIRRSAFTRSSRRKPAGRDNEGWPPTGRVSDRPVTAGNGETLDFMNHSRIPLPLGSEFARSHNASGQYGGQDVPLPRHQAVHPTTQVDGDPLGSSNVVPHDHVTRKRSGNNCVGGRGSNGVVARQPVGPDILSHVDRPLRGPADRSPSDSEGTTGQFSAPYLSKNILSIESVSSSTKSSRSSVTRSVSSASRRSSNLPLPPPPPPPPQENRILTPHLETEEANQGLSSRSSPLLEDYDNVPPPLPPKLSVPDGRSGDLPLQGAPRAYTVDEPDPEIPFIESSNFALNEIKPAIHGVQLRNLDKALSASEVSIPSLAAGEPRTPSQYEMLEQKMIKAGFYSVPKKPPIPPTSKCNASKADLDPDVSQALTELDMATKNLDYHSAESSDGKESSSTSDSHGGRYGVVAVSESEDSSSSNDISFNKNLLTPIPMQFDDHYTGPDYGGTDALSSFAVEMEASFDRIKQSLSGDRLDNGRTKALPVRRPYANNTEVPTTPDHGHFANSTSIKPRPSELKNRPMHCNANSDNNFAPRWRIIRRESDEIVDL